MPYTQWLPIALTVAVAAFCFWPEVTDFMASKRKRKKQMTIAQKYPRVVDDDYEDSLYGWHGYAHWPRQDDVLNDMANAIIEGKTRPLTQEKSE